MKHTNRNWYKHPAKKRIPARQDFSTLTTVNFRSLLDALDAWVEKAENWQPTIEQYEFNTYVPRKTWEKLAANPKFSTTKQKTDLT